MAFVKMVLNLFAFITFISIITMSAMVSATGASRINYECIPSNAQASGSGVANCSAQQLAHVPPNLPHNIRVLDLSNNYITELMDNSFVKYEYMEMLYLHNNSLSLMGPRVFKRLSNVRYLDMSFNNIESIPSQAFADLRALLTLSLRGNKIMTIRSGSFANLGKLTNLYLSGNHIRNIHPDGFSGLEHLQHLELQNNALSHINGSMSKHFGTSLREIKLFHNPWYCDCNLRWLLFWLKNSSETDGQRLRWKYSIDEPVCHGPSIVEQRPFSSLSGDWFICPIRMYSKARNTETARGSEVELFCKYTSDPQVEMRWLKNGKDINLQRSDKYKVETEGTQMLISKLHVYDFRYADIGEYECYAENRLGRAYDSCLVTLQGVDAAVVLQPSTDDTGDGDRVRNVIIASATIGSVLLVLAIVLIFFCCITRCKRYHKKKKESIRMSFEEHLKANGIIEPNPKQEAMIYDEVPIDGNGSIDEEVEETESVYNSLQRPRIPSSTNTNTYISFKSEFSEPDDMTQMYSQGQQTSTSNSKGSDGSQCESTSPLLENVSPILIDPHDPFYEANLYVPRLYASTNNYLSSTHNDDYDDDNGFLTQRRIDSDFIPYRDEHGFILPSRPMNGHGPHHGHHVPHRALTLPHNGHLVRDPHLVSDEIYIPYRTRTLPHNCSPHIMDEYGSVPHVVRHNTVSAKNKSASVGHLGMCPPKKPPRSFNSRDTVSLYSQGSVGERENGFKLSLPKPGTVDKYGTAV